MAILSYEFALCFALFFMIYWAFYRRPQIQNALLVLASIAFILTWQWLFLVSITFVWLVLQACSYAFIKLDASPRHSDTRKKIILLVGIAILVAHLCFFKYSNFVIEQLNLSVLRDSNSLTPLDIVMPIGISFYTFQAISYLVDVYQDKMKPMPSAVLFGFLSFIPTLTAGPIFRAREAQRQWQLSDGSNHDVNNVIKNNLTGAPHQDSLTKNAKINLDDNGIKTSKSVTKSRFAFIPPIPFVNAHQSKHPFGLKPVSPSDAPSVDANTGNVDTGHTETDIVEKDIVEKDRNVANWQGKAKPDVLKTSTPRNNYLRINNDEYRASVQTSVKPNHTHKEATEPSIQATNNNQTSDADFIDLTITSALNKNDVYFVDTPIDTSIDDAVDDTLTSKSPKALPTDQGNTAPTKTIENAHGKNERAKDAPKSSALVNNKPVNTPTQLISQTSDQAPTTDDSYKALWQRTSQQSPLFHRVDISAGLQVGNNTPAVSAPTLSYRYVIMPYIALALIGIALLKKLVLAGWLESLWVSPVFANPMQFHGLEVLTAIYAYSLQLFFDFSGYTDLVIAIALLLGFKLPENFKQPYLATDIQDFWKRWHITLSTWIRDYLYIPLGGGRRSFLRVQINLMLAFVISGVWHGAGWNFFVWGAIHGVALVFLNVLKRFKMRSWLTKHAKPAAIFITFHYVAFGWIFFHSVTFDQALQVIEALGNYNGILFTLPVVPTLLAMVVAWVAYPYLGHARETLAKGLSALPWWLLPIPIALYVVLIFNLAPEGLPGFIYANF